MDLPVNILGVGPMEILSIVVLALIIFAQQPSRGLVNLRMSIR
jgi:hypothetical protein